ncbi:hypothetical protein PI124_g18365 [Phytophthora idaei]|nr:hypothetical protein PI125_g19066 [Phytophthora idaei]KAG3141720.1 hypothetical protein PI126_g15361 [Phytophthora idaei]KAG3236628.1 hypothetical protein PI124_g18365 [Phytophthora idaei]
MIRLSPGGQAIVVTDVERNATEATTVLVEGLPGLNDAVKIVRTLCPAQSGKLLVEACNASRDDVVIRRGARLAVATAVPESAFEAGCDRTEAEASRTAVTDTDWIGDIIDAAATKVLDDSQAGAGLEKVKLEALKVAFTGSTLNKEHQQLIRDLLETFRDLFVETSMTPRRADLLAFSIDTGAHLPIKQRSYRVSKVEGDLMESAIQPYLSLGHIRPSISPSATPVLMIKKARWLNPFLH